MIVGDVVRLCFLLFSSCLPRRFGPQTSYLSIPVEFWTSSQTNGAALFISLWTAPAKIKLKDRLQRLWRFKNKGKKEDMMQPACITSCPLYDSTEVPFFVLDAWIIYILTCLLKSSGKWRYYQTMTCPQLVHRAFLCGSNAGSLRMIHNNLSALGKEVACSLESCGNVFTIVFVTFPSLYCLPCHSNSKRARVSLWLPRRGFRASDNTREQVRSECP